MADADSKEIAPRSRFVKGVSGNPNGRPKGSKNKITLMKLALEGDLRTQMRPHMADILAMAIMKAKEGDPAMIKLLLDKTLPTTKAADDEAPAKERVQVFIGALPERGEKAVQGRIFDNDNDGDTNE
jgi:hypothetical protein